MPFKPNSFFKFNVNHYDFFINLRDLHKIFYTLIKSKILEKQGKNDEAAEYRRWSEEEYKKYIQSRET